MQMGIFPDKPWELYFWDKDEEDYFFKVPVPTSKHEEYQLRFYLKTNECDWAHVRCIAFEEDDYDWELIDSLYVGENYG